jgi:methylmalonyl-CoA mutase C-terminal domain/subunit
MPERTEPERTEPRRTDPERSEPAAPGRASPIRVLIAKPGLDGHDRGIKVIARALRDAGMEVLYLGLRVTPRAVALAAAQEDVDAVGLSNLSGAHLTVFPEVARELEAAGVDLDQVVLFGGGTIPEADRPALRAAGFRGVFGPETPMADIVRFLEKETRGR